MAEIFTATYPVVGLGTSHSRKCPDIDSGIYDWRVVQWIGNYNVAKIEYWIPDPPSTDPSSIDSF
jgi:hypothetical protein